jgi:hypothetical protein
MDQGLDRSQGIPIYRNPEISHGLWRDSKDASNIFV